MDWLSAVIGAAIGIFSTIFAYEYKRWRGRKIELGKRRKQAAGLLRSELNKVITSWEIFKKTEEMHVDPGLGNFQRELESISRSLRNIASASHGLVSEDVLNKTIEIVELLTRLSQMRFFLNGGQSWNEFLELGDRIIKQCRELDQKLA
ncbi:MAG: hypothetical protein QXP36_02240 [Conexivisphaerales archaeon]